VEQSRKAALDLHGSSSEAPSATTSVSVSGETQRLSTMVQQEGVPQAPDEPRVQKPPLHTPEDPAPHASPEALPLQQTPETCAQPDLRTVRISSQGGASGEKFKQRMVPELAAGAKHALIAKGFTSVEQGIVVKEAQLTFPCAVSARAFYLLFDNYEWESSNGCMSTTIRVHSHGFQRDMDNPTLKQLFVSSSAITPSNILEHFPSH